MVYIFDKKSKGSGIKSTNSCQNNKLQMNFINQLL